MSLEQTTYDGHIRAALIAPTNEVRALVHYTFAMMMNLEHEEVRTTVDPAPTYDKRNIFKSACLIFGAKERGAKDKTTIDKVRRIFNVVFGLAVPAKIYEEI